MYRSEILAYLETDRLYASYAIGDLEPGLFEQCSWAGAEQAGRLAALILLFRGLRPPPLFLMGDSTGLRAILENVQYPERLYLTCRSEHLSMTRDYFAWDKTVPMWRMVLNPNRFQAGRSTCIRLSPAHHDLLTELYSLGGGDAFDLAQLQHGAFYGVLVENRLVAVAGTHLVSPTYGVAAVGNVFTHPHYLRRGYGTATTRAVVAELLARGIQDVILNVGQTNASAIHIYERLGFERYCPFFEGSASAHKSTTQRSTSGSRMRPEEDEAGEGKS
ncbi:MAG: GNAT family N-acetyltransferase [Anaerolineae bacterium]